MNRIYRWFLHFRKVKTVKQAKEMGIIFWRNVYGDEINQRNCRSLWYDKYLNDYRCNQAYNFSIPKKAKLNQKK